MNILKQLALIFVICIFGQLVSAQLPFTFPASVLSMLLMFLLLLSKTIKLQDIKEVAEFLLANMAFFFIPAGVGILEHYPAVEGKILLLILICLLTTLTTFLATAYTVSFLLNWQERRKGEQL